MSFDLITTSGKEHQCPYLSYAVKKACELGLLNQNAINSLYNEAAALAQARVEGSHLGGDLDAIKSKQVQIFLNLVEIGLEYLATQKKVRPWLLLTEPTPLQTAYEHGKAFLLKLKERCGETRKAFCFGKRNFLPLDSACASMALDGLENLGEQIKSLAEALVYRDSEKQMCELLLFLAELLGPDYRKQIEEIEKHPAWGSYILATADERLAAVEKKAEGNSINLYTILGTVFANILADGKAVFKIINGPSAAQLIGQLREASATQVRDKIKTWFEKTKGKSLAPWLATVNEMIDQMLEGVSRLSINSFRYTEVFAHQPLPKRFANEVADCENDLIEVWAQDFERATDNDERSELLKDKTPAQITSVLLKWTHQFKHEKKLADMVQLLVPTLLYQLPAKQFGELMRLIDAEERGEVGSFAQNYALTIAPVWLDYKRGRLEEHTWKEAVGKVFMPACASIFCALPARDRKATEVRKLLQRK